MPFRISKVVVLLLRQNNKNGEKVNDARKTVHLKLSMKTARKFFFVFNMIKISKISIKILYIRCYLVTREIRENNSVSFNRITPNSSYQSTQSHSCPFRAKRSNPIFILFPRLFWHVWHFFFKKKNLDLIWPFDMISPKSP